MSAKKHLVVLASDSFIQLNVAARQLRFPEHEGVERGCGTFVPCEEEARCQAQGLAAAMGSWQDGNVRGGGGSCFEIPASWTSLLVAHSRWFR